jgi:PAS domain S-box-containing protein
MFDYVHPEDQAFGISAFLDEVKQIPHVRFISIRLLTRSGEWIWCRIRGHNLISDPHVKGMVIYFANEQEHKQTEQLLERSEKSFRHLIENLNQGVMVLNKQGKVLVANRAASQIVGIPEEELTSMDRNATDWDIIHEDGSEFPRDESPVELALKTGQPVKDVVMGFWNAQKNERVWLLINADPNPDNDGVIADLVITFTDITEQKRLSLELFRQEMQRQKLLTQATIDGQEKERLEMGKELHDNINQHLNTTRLYLEVAREKATGEVLEMINLSHKALAGIIDQIRMLSQSLVPPTLGDLGLVESIQDVCDSLHRTHKFRISFVHRHFVEEGLPDNMRLMLFRITQEQINNIIRHANARSIEIKLQSDAEYVILSIGDDGQGFDPGHFKKGLGFTNIMNRAGLFNGNVEIDAGKGKGCRLSVIIPIDYTGREEEDLF